MKKSMILVLTVLLTVSILVGCAAPAVTPAPTDVPEVAVVTDPATESVSTESVPTEPLPAEPQPTEPEEIVFTVPKEMVRYYQDVQVSGNIPVHKAPVAPLNVTRTLPDIQAQDGIEPYSDFWWGDKRVNADLSDNPALAYSLTFSNQTVFKKMPEGYDAEALLQWGKDPGLNVDILHKHGFTGKGAVIAYVDQPISNHPAFANVNLHYTNNSESNDSMHGPSVLSLLAGQEIGTAPEAEVYFYGHASWRLDQTTHAECLYQIIEQNKQLPEGERITMVGFSDNPDSGEKNIEAFQTAIKACEEAGIMVWFCGEYEVASYLPFSDKNNASNAVRDGVHGRGIPKLVHVPGGGRTAANENNTYTYWSSGGVSWTMPYVLGLYAIVLEIDPSLTQDVLRKMIVETAYDANGMKLINPVGFVAKALQNVGRNEEAQAMLDEVAARTKYLYAVMNASKMNTADLTVVRDYLALMTDVNVLVVDASYFHSAEQLYTALQKDAQERGGEVTGVQIFGTADMVPAFNLQYKVQMISGVDDAGTFMSDLFYSNFENDPGIISNGYNVMDHFEQDWDVDLVPQWPVARLPLSTGEFSAFFEKYNAFLKTTGLQRLELVNFSNPIFASPHHTDDMGTFLNRMNQEFHLLDIPYRLYGNKLGQYPVTTATHGGFTAEELTAENVAGIAEFLINSHGQWNNIDKCFYEGGKEKRESLINMNTVNTVLADNPYYLDCWTCNNGYGMKNNLTTTALNGNCVGMFSTTHIVSNNGVNCDASVPQMMQSNFYYFYYHYLKALHEGKARGAAFFTAQQQYAAALVADSANGIRVGEGNYQFNLGNLLAYHNFGVLEPGFAAVPFATVDVAALAAEMEGAKEEKYSEAYVAKGMMPKVEVHSMTKRELENGKTRFAVEYTAPKGVTVEVYSALNGAVYAVTATGERETFTFDISNKKLPYLKALKVKFYKPDGFGPVLVDFTPQKIE